MTFKEKYGNTALVAGASEGMGAAYAKALAAHGLDIALIARREGPLKVMAAELNSQYGVTTYPIICDLASSDAVEQIVQATAGMEISFMVYNAASSYIGPYLETGLTTHENIATVNMLTEMALLHHFGGLMVARKRGGVVLMSSIAGFQGAGFLATYAATKAFSRVLAEGLWYEWKNKGVDVIACCAGATATPNYINTNPGKASPLEPKPQTPEAVVKECLRRIGKTPSFISGRGNRFVSFLMQHIFSRKMAVNMISDGMRKMYGIDG
jgi:short-subunit dehydrogenase